MNAVGRPAAGTSLIVAAVALGAAEVLAHPDVPGDDPASLLAAAAAQPSRWTAWCLLLIVASVFFVPAVAALVRRIKGRGVALTRIGGAVFTTGVVLLPAFALANALYVPLAGSGQIAPDVVAALRRAEADPTLAVSILLSFAGFHLGLPLLLGGLRRARFIPSWSLWLGTVGAISAVPLSNVSSILERLCFALVSLALLAPGIALLRRPRAVSGDGELREAMGEQAVVDQ